MPANARFCPACGVQLDAGETARTPLPPEETGPVPVSTGVAPLRVSDGVRGGALALATPARAVTLASSWRQIQSSRVWLQPSSDASAFTRTAVIRV